ncbi:MAG: hypothetical protein ACQEXG_03590 [Pseudomonadota bacterium]
MSSLPARFTACRAMAALMVVALAGCTAAMRLGMSRSLLIAGREVMARQKRRPPATAPRPPLDT